MKPTDILRIAEPIEKMYMDCVSQLIINLSGHFDINDVTPTAEWETKKLSELGALTNESIEIIAANTGQKAIDIRKAVTEGLGLEIKDTEKVLQGAANKGLIQGASQSWEASESVKTVVKNLTEQANSDLNVVNTTMLQSTREQYVWAVQNTANAEMVFAQAQQAMNTAAMTVAIGVEARTQALRRTIKQLADNGITGYVDRAGHKWSPEAYVNMNIRTTVHNAAVQGQKARSADYGVDTFQISSHNGARKRCAPYQGKFYSWTETGGVVEDLYGNKYKFENINVTSYGEPAGIFGINCGHSPQTFVSGYNIPRYEPTEDFEKNAEEYKLSQKQRYYERQIRDAKTEALAYDAAGDKEAFQRKAVQIKEKNARYKAFCEENNLTPKLDRTQVMAYNRSAAGKANAAVRRADQKANYLTNIKPTLPKDNAPLANTLLQSTIDVAGMKTKGGYLLNSVVPNKATVENVRIIAGYGVQKDIRKAKEITKLYGGEAYKWQKVGGIVSGKEYSYDIHWYQYADSQKHYDYAIKNIKEIKK